MSSSPGGIPAVSNYFMKKVEVCAGELECFWGHHSGKGVMGNVEPVLCPSVRMAQVLGSVGHSSRVRKIIQEGEESEKTEVALEMSNSWYEKRPGLRWPSECWSSQESDCGEEE